MLGTTTLRTFAMYSAGLEMIQLVTSLAIQLVSECVFPDTQTQTLTVLHVLEISKSLTVLNVTQISRDQTVMHAFLGILGPAVIYVLVTFKNQTALSVIQSFGDQTATYVYKITIHKEFVMYSVSLEMMKEVTSLAV